MLEQTPIVILAGGLGTRLRTSLPDRPKGLAPIGPYAFLEIQIQLLHQPGARHFVLCVGHHADQIQFALGDGRALGVQIEYSVEAPDCLLGTAGALKKAERFFAPRALVLNGDTYFDIDYTALLHRHFEEQQRSGAHATLAITRLDRFEQFGNVVLDTSGQFIRAFHEKNTRAGAEWVSGGAYVIEHSLLERIQPDKPCSLENDIFPRALAMGDKLAAMTFTNHFFDIGTPNSWRSFIKYYSELHHNEKHR